MATAFFKLTMYGSYLLFNTYKAVSEGSLVIICVTQDHTYTNNFTHDLFKIPLNTKNLKSMESFKEEF